MAVEKEQKFFKIKLSNDWYEENERLFRKTNIELKPGVTVLVGCNGSGKTTFLQQLQTQLKKEKTPCLAFDNLQDGGSQSISAAGFYEDFSFMSQAMCSSEGETILLNIERLAGKLRNFIATGELKSKSRDIHQAFAEVSGRKVKELPVASNERFLLLDAVDSGLSIDNVIDIKDLFRLVLEDAKERDVYIIVSANGYEMVRGEECLDVRNGKYVSFRDYEEYRDFILKSREVKNARYEKTEQKKRNNEDYESER